jgi:hypothetical protein
LEDNTKGTESPALLPIKFYFIIKFDPQIFENKLKNAA